MWGGGDCAVLPLYPKCTCSSKMAVAAPRRMTEAEHHVLVPAAGEAGPSQAAVEEGHQGGAEPSLLHTVNTAW